MIVKGLVTKFLSFFLFFLYVFSSSLNFCHAGEKAVIRSATYVADSVKSGVIHLKVEGQALPLVSLLGGDLPRLILDFPDTSYSTPNKVDISTDGPVETLRFGLHQNPLKTRVVVDINPECKVNSPDVVVNGDLVAIHVDCIATKPVVPHFAAVDKIVVTATESVPKQNDVVQQIIDRLTLPPASSALQIDAGTVEKKVVLNEASSSGPDTQMTTEKKPLLLYDIVFESKAEKGEMVLFYLSDFIPPSVSAVEKNSLLVHCDFQDVQLAEKIQSTITTTGSFIRKISTKKESKPEKIRVELELSPEHDYDLQQIFYKKDNVFALIINAKLEKSPSKE